MNGRDGVRDYWQRQLVCLLIRAWSRKAFSTDGEVINFCQGERDRALTRRARRSHPQTVQHADQMQDGLVRPTGYLIIHPRCALKESALSAPQ